MRGHMHGGPGRGPGGPGGPGMGRPGFGGPGRGPGFGGPGMPPPPPPPRRGFGSYRPYRRGGCLGCLIPILLMSAALISLVAAFFF